MGVAASNGAARWQRLSISQSGDHACRQAASWLVLGLISTAYFMVVLDSVVVITALPRRMP